MGFLQDKCDIFHHTAEKLLQSRPFSCGDVDNERTIKFYENNGFKTVFSSESQEKKHIGLPDEIELKTRFMYFDLMIT